MNFRGFSKAAVTGIAISSFAVANAQFAPPSSPVLPYNLSSPTYSLSSSSLLSYSGDHQMWNTVLIISGIIFVVGLADSDAALTVIGAAGVVLSLVETSGSHLQFGPSYREFDIASRGPFSFGFSSFTRGMYGPMDHVRPCISYAVRF